MSDIAILKEMLLRSATVPLEPDRYDKGMMVRLCEPKSTDHTGYSVEIRGLPNQEDCVVIKADEFPPTLKFFQGTKGERKRADFIIVANNNNKNVIICIELKAEKQTKPPSEIIQQLKGAQCVIGYCQQIAKHFWGQAQFLEGYEYRFVTMRDISISKKPSFSRVNHTVSHNTPENMLKIDSPYNLYLKQLISGSK